MVLSINKLSVTAAFLLLSIALILGISCKSDTTGGQNPPQSSFAIVSPENGASVVGSRQIVIEVVDINITSIDVKLDGSTNPVHTLTDEPYTFLIDLSLFDTGTTHTITVEGRNGGSIVATDTIDLVRSAFGNSICTTATGGDATLVDCLSDLYNSGLVAENIIDSYENRDGDHTTLNTSRHPLVTYINGPYGISDIGLTSQNNNPDAPLVGNASLCYNAGAGWCEGIVRYLLRGGSASRMYDLYSGNNFYWFPEHQDHDGEDLAFYMVPFTNSSQGSSGSEMDEVEKWLYTLAAFTPETKAVLISSNVLMPTVQMIYRRTRVAGDTEYLSGLAHANAFENVSNAHTMARVANNMAADEIPPMVQLTVLEDTFDSSSGEAAFTTPVAIARRWRTDAATPRRIVVSAQDSFDPNGRPLTFHWQLIRGDSEHVRITPLGEDGVSAEIEIDFHAAEQIQIGSEERTSTLVSVAVFAHNGVYFSAPAFITSSTQDYVP